MNIKKKFKKIKIKPILKKIKLFLLREDCFKDDISFDSAIKVFAISIPVFSLIYLSFFFENFTVNYFIYFNPTDLIQTYYQQNFLALVSIVIFGLFVLFLRTNYKKNSNKAPLNLIFIALVIIDLFIAYKLKTDIDFSNSNEIIAYILFSLILFKFFVYWSNFSLSTIIYYLVIFQSLTAILIGNYEAEHILKNKYNFDVILNDNEYLMKENKDDHCIFFIGNTSNYFFVYDGFKEKVVVKPMNEIKEIRFTPNTKFFTQP